MAGCDFFTTLHPVLVGKPSLDPVDKRTRCGEPDRTGWKGNSAINSESVSLAAFTKQFGSRQHVEEGRRLHFKWPQQKDRQEDRRASSSSPIMQSIKFCGKLWGSCAQLRLKHCEAVTAGVSDAAEIFMSAVPYRIQ